MKIIKFLTLCCIVVLMTSASAHKFYVSITNIEYVPKEKSLQIITKVFIDDVEATLEKRYGTKLHFDTKLETAKEGELLQKYIEQKLTISVNGKPVTFEYIGHKYDIDVVKSYMEVTGLEKFSKIEVENLLLFDAFEDQQNIIHVKTGDRRRSLILEKENPKGLLKFD
jgi:hypothetical protein